jgi:hypothetical protein
MHRGHDDGRKKIYEELQKTTVHDEISHQAYTSLQCVPELCIP